MHEYEGTIAQFLGDGFLAFFGAPVAHEDDPSRAVRAGLEIVRRAEAYRSRVPHIEFAVRVGINSGLVVVGPVGTDLKFEYLAVGDAVNVAARIQTVAPPMGVAVSEATYGPVAAEFEWSDLGQQAVKGRSSNVHAYQAIHALGPSTRQEIGLGTPFVGRDIDLTRLASLCEAVRAGLGRVALIIGEPGIGKSRLLREWRERDRDRADVRWITASCVSHGRQLAYRMLSDLVRGVAGIAPETPDDAAHMALVGLVGDHHAGALAQLLGLRVERSEHDEFFRISPQALQARYLAAARDLVVAAGRREPLVLACNDVHWADPSSVELTSKLLSLVAEAPILFCLATRPDRDAPGWALVTMARQIAGSALVEIQLEPLTADESERVLIGVLGGQTVPGLPAFVAKAEGNPLFLEQLVHWLIDHRVLAREADRWVIAAPVQAIEVPDSLRGLLHARMDRLAPTARRVLRVASVIGRLVPAGLLRVATQLEDALVTETAALEAAGLLRLAATGPEPLYEFRHALIQDVAYASLLKEDRRRLHAIIGAELERSRDTEPAILARHFEVAGDAPRAARFFADAAQRARARYANAEAIDLYRRSIAQHEAAGSPADDRARLHEALGDILELTGARTEARDAFARALSLLAEGERLERSLVHTKMGSSHSLAHQHDEAELAFAKAADELELAPTRDHAWWSRWLDVRMAHMQALYWANRADRIDQIASETQAPLRDHGTAGHRAAYYRAIGMSAYRREGYALSRATVDAAERGLEAARELGDEGLGMAVFNVGFAHLWSGDLDGATARVSESLAIALRTGDVTLEARGETYLAVAARRRGDIDTARIHTDRASAAALKSGTPEYVALANGNRAWLAWRAGDDAAATREGEAGLSALSRLPFPHPFRWIAILPFIAALRRRGSIDEALALLPALLEPTQHRLPESLADTLRLAATSGPQAARVAALDDAITLARKHGYL